MKLVKFGFALAFAALFSACSKATLPSGTDFQMIENNLLQIPGVKSVEQPTHYKDMCFIRVTVEDQQNLDPRIMNPGSSVLTDKFSHCVITANSG